MDSRRELEGGNHRVLEGDRFNLILEVQLEGLLEVLQGAIDRVPLARDLYLEATGNEPIALMGDGGRELHSQSIDASSDEPCPTRLVLGDPESSTARTRGRRNVIRPRERVRRGPRMACALHLMYRTDRGSDIPRDLADENGERWITIYAREGGTPWKYRLSDFLFALKRAEVHLDSAEPII
jgi:hypothetical protein